jgi:hypothetical protein
LTFAVGRYLPEQKAFVPLSSPFRQGIKALALQSAADSSGALVIGNPNFFTINFYSRFTAQLGAFLNQQ